MFIASVICVQTFAIPASVAAQEVTDTVPMEPTTSESVTTTETSTPPEETSITDPAPSPAPPPPPEVVDPTPPADVGPQSPTGSDSNAYTQNADGTWENEYYIWDPVTNQTKPKQQQQYSFNPATGMWDTTEWYFKPETGTYEPNVVSYAYNPLAISGNSISGTGPNSNNQISDSSSSNAIFNLFFDGTISNKINSTAISGNAGVQGNTIGGSALTGDAMVIANILNMLQSSWFGQSSDVSSFIANLDGSIYGDLFIDPSQLAGGSGNSNVDINVSNNGNINNDIDLVAQSGDANVEDNTQAGNAESGNALALLNLFNLINSSISANKSFIGVLNINGDLNGDILLPEGLLEFLIAASGPNSNNQISSNQDNSLDVDVEKNRTIINDVNTDASSGSALVDSNTSAGSATSGTADTKVNTLNLVGQNIQAKNGLLVFINVFGSWIGLIFNAPQGTNSIATTGPDSNNTINSDNSNSVSVDATEDSLINNDIDVSANSGDAAVRHNTQAGDASSGNASVSVNILNMIDSSFDITDWFGVLFINVFGSWIGSFGMDTTAGENPVGSASGGVFQLGTSSAASQNSQNNSDNPISKARSFIASIAAGSGGANEVQSVQTASATSSASKANGSGAGESQNNSGLASSGGDSNTRQILLASAISLIAISMLYAVDNRYSLLSRIRH
jgi:hypothetical protein